MSAWTKYLRKDWIPFLIIISKEYNYKGIVPLMLRDEKRKGILPYRRIRFLARNFNDFSLILAEKKHMGKVVAHAMEWLFSGDLRWELLILDDLMEGNPAIEALETWFINNKISYETVVGKYYFINLDSAWEVIWKETSNKFVRRSVNLARNRITKAGKWDILKNPNWGDEQLIIEASFMHSERQKELGRASFYNDKKSELFLLKVIEHTKKIGLFNSYWLRFEDRYIAYMFGFEQDEVYYAWNMAFNPDYSHFFPSKLLLSEIIKDCYERKLKAFSFMRGESEYKSKWTKQYKKNYRFIIKNAKSAYGKIYKLIDSLQK